MESNVINSNTISFIGLASEYCNAVENASQADRNDFTNSMLKLLPRLYIVATDLTAPLFADDGYIADALDEDHYEQVRADIAALYGEDDTYLEVFVDDMKFSDTPVAASISEGLADLFQVMYNFVETVRDATDETIALAIESVREDFRTYWSRPLLNTLRALNALAAEE